MPLHQRASSVDSDTLPPATAFVSRSLPLVERAASGDASTLAALPASIFAQAAVADKPSRGQGERSMRDSIDAAMRSSADTQQRCVCADSLVGPPCSRSLSMPAERVMHSRPVLHNRFLTEVPIRWGTSCASLHAPQSTFAKAALCSLADVRAAALEQVQPVLYSAECQISHTNQSRGLS